MFNPRATSQPPVRTAFPGRGAYLVLAIAGMVWAVYASLIPFDLHPMPVGVAWDQFLDGIVQRPEGRVSRSDVLANILLFVPVGFGLAGALLLERRRILLLVAPLVIFPVSLAASVVAEFVQVFTADRVPSNLDIAAQTLGTAIGLGAWLMAGRGLTLWLRGALASSGDDRLSRVLVAYAGAWAFVNLAPFDITVDVGDLGERVREGKIALLADTGSVARFAWDALSELLAAAPLGILGVAGWGGRRTRSRFEAFAIGALIVVGVETAQVFIRSHSATGSDLLFAWTGVAIGVVFGTRALGALPPAAGHVTATPWLGAVVVWCLVICAYHWQPYDFAVDSELIRRKLARMSLVPFAGYLGGSPLNALNNLLTKLALAVPLGVLASFAFTGPPPRRLALAVWLVGAAAIFAIVEAGQFFLPPRLPDPTDVVVGVAGAAGGLALGRWLRAERSQGE